MQLTKVTITNIRAIDFLEFQVGALTIVRAHNGKGKTTVVESVKAVFEGGHDPSLVRQGCKKGTIVLAMDDGTTIEKVITLKSSTLTVKTSDGVVVPAPATYVASLASGFAFDPLGFITAPKADRAKFLAAAMPIEITAEQILAAVELKPMAPKVAEYMPEDVKTFTLPLLMTLRKQAYESRAAVTKQRKTQEGGIDALRKTLPGNWKPEGDPQEIVADANEKLSAANTVLADLKRERDERVVELDKVNDQSVLEVMKWEAEEIDKIRLAATAKRETIALAYKEVRDAAYHSKDDEIEAAQEAVTQATSNCNAARETAKGWAVQAQTAATISQYSADMRKSIAEEEILTGLIEAIDKAKEQAMAKTPIPEIVTMDGEVFYRQPGLEEPVPFDAVNTQMQFMLALKIASLGAGKLGFMCVDGSEALVGENFENFRKACVESGFQVLATRADSNYEEIDVETMAAIEEAAQ